MRSFGKHLALLFIIIMAASSMTLFMTKPVEAQSVPTPSAPEFYLNVVDAPYMVTSTNHSNGQTETRQVSDRYVELTVKNQPFNYANSSYNVYYTVRFKPNFDNSGWWLKEGVMNITSSPVDEYGVQSYALYLPNGAVEQSSGENTTLTFALAQTGSVYSLGYYHDGVELMGDSYRSDGKIDFQVQAMVGHGSQIWATAIDDYDNATVSNTGFYPATAYDSSSGWSSTQTLDLAYYPLADPSPTTSAAASTSLSGWFWIVIAGTLVAVLLVAAAVKGKWLG